jgi:hypothetical protein
MLYEYYNTNSEKSIDSVNLPDPINSIDSIDSKYWGKHTWIFLNSIALTYDVINKEEYLKFLNQLQYILPCTKCRDHFKKNLLTLTDNDLKNRQSLLNWLIKVRNSIYTEQNRPIIITKTDTLKEIFNNYNDTDNNYNYYSNILLLVFLVIIIILLFILYKN